MLNAWHTDPWFRENAPAVLTAAQALTKLRAQDEPEEQPEIPERDHAEIEERIRERQGD